MGRDSDDRDRYGGRHHPKKRKRDRSGSRDRSSHHKSSRQSRLGDHDFERHRNKLNRIFFRSENPDEAPPFAGSGKNGTQDVEADFWKFLRQYKAFEKRKGTSSTVDKTLKGQCFTLQPEDPKDLLNRIPFQGKPRIFIFSLTVT